jgi:hypothetical protein
MKSQEKKAGQRSGNSEQRQAKQPTNPLGQNPKQNDSPDHDVHHDEKRVNPPAKK